jgi:putative flippase GtrA
MLKKTNSIFHEIKKMILYAGNGIINTIVCYGLLLVLVNLTDYRLAIVLVYIPGILLSYYLNRRIVFKNKGHFLIFVIISVLMLCTTVIITWISVEVLQLPKIVSMSIAIAVVFFLGYSLNKHFSFRKKAVKTRLS